MTELINFPDGTTQHAYLTTDNANDDLEIAVLDGDLVILDTNENPVLRWDASATQWDFVSQDVVGVGSLAADALTVNGQSGVELPQDVSGSRTLGSWETNNTGSPIIVTTNLFISSSNVSAGDDVRVSLDINDTQSNQTVFSDAVLNAGGGENISLGLFGIVPDGEEYQVRALVDDTGSLSVGSNNSWFEQKVGI